MFHYTPSSLGGHHSSSHGPTGRSTKLNTIETISKKRTRKVRRGDDELGLDMQMTRLDSDEEEEEEEVERDNGTDIFKSNTTTTSSPPGSRDEEVEKGSQANVGSGLFNLTGRKSMKRKTSSQSATWRPDEDEMCLTTTFVQGKDVASGLRVDEESLDGGGSSAGRNGGYVERVSGGPAPAPGLGQGNIEVVVTREFAWESTRER